LPEKPAFTIVIAKAFAETSVSESPALECSQTHEQPKAEFSAHRKFLSGAKQGGISALLFGAYSVFKDPTVAPLVQPFICRRRSFRALPYTCRAVKRLSLFTYLNQPIAGAV